MSSWVRLTSPIFVALACLFQSLPLHGESFKENFSAGIAYEGVLIHYGLNARWAAELRYLRDTSNSDSGKLLTELYSLRGYRYFQRSGRLRLYLGSELGLIQSWASNAGAQASGQALGAFAGSEYHLSQRVSLSFDMGPAIIAATEKTTHTRDAGLDFVVNSALSYYLF